MGDKEATGAEVREDMKKNSGAFDLPKRKKEETRSVGGNRRIM